MVEFSYTGDQWETGVMILRALETYREQTGDSFSVNSTFAHKPQTITISIPAGRVSLLQAIAHNM